MAEIEKSKHFHILKAKLAILALFSFLLIPSYSFKGENSHWIERADNSNKEILELLDIYSVLRSQRMDLSDGWAWDVSNAILEESRRHSLDPMLVLAVINVESSFQDTAISTEGARGLMQILPVVADALVEELRSRDLMVEGSADDSLNPSTLNPLNLDDPVLNIKLGVFYLHHLKKNFRDLKLALTAYNWGPTEVRNRLQEDEMLPLEYAMKVLSTYYGYRKDSRPGQNTP